MMICLVTTWVQLSRSFDMGYRLEKKGNNQAQDGNCDHCYTHTGFSLSSQPLPGSVFLCRCGPVPLPSFRYGQGQVWVV